MYQALYRKYRPQSWEDVVGQSHVTSTLAREITEGRVAHAYLFAGPRGTGKTTTARILAKALNCEHRLPDGSPDNECPSCQGITEGSSLDVMELDAASHNSVEDIRDMRLSVSTVASGPNSRRVYILDEAHMLSKAAGNALLKTLEEPPPHVIFVLATTEPYKLADTIRSRTQRFDFHPVGIEALAAHLGRIADLEGYKTNAKALVALARHAGGSARDALSLLEQVAALGSDVVDLGGVQRALGMADTEAYAALVEAVAKADARTGLELVAEMSARGIDLRRFVGEAIGFFRGVFLAHYAPNLSEVTDEPPEVLEAWKKAAKIVGPAAVLRAVDLLGEALIRLREGREERLMVELAVIRLTRPETSSDPDALTARLERLERGSVEVSPLVASSVAPPSPATPVLPPAGGETSSKKFPPPANEVSLGGGGAAGDGGGSGSLTMEAVQRIWPSLFGSLRQVLGPRRWALFREAAPGDVEEGRRLILDVSQDFHLEGLRTDPVVSALVATQAADLLGFPIEVGFRKTGDLPEADDIPVDEGSLDKDRLFEAPPEAIDPTALLEKELGATLVVEDDERV
ncbi:MAG TPA: DNA polymerase III subunit gamma/tau [Acidimicrobiia bacterium]|nr:DNA polymerase III subunit gamma/tau [Acidimicrobiia bacterium]